MARRTRKIVSDAKQFGAAIGKQSLPILRDNARSLDQSAHVAVAAAIGAQAPKSLQTLVELRDNKKTSPRTRADIAMKMLHLAGHVEPRAKAESGADIPMHEMNVDELRALADQLQGEISARAKPLNAPNAPVVPAELSDILE